MEKKFTKIATKKGYFEVFVDGKKYFLKYLENDDPKKAQKVGYLVKEGGAGFDGYYLQEAFFDKRNWPHTSLRSVLGDCGAEISSDLWDNLFAACYQTEQEFWCKDSKDSKRKRKLDEKGQKWSELIDKLQKGTDLETAVRSL